MAGALERDLASAFARVTLGHLERPWPYHHMQVLSCAQDQLLPAQAHPVFHGSFDWHSCVHGWWQVMRLARLYPDLPEAAGIEARADRMLTDEKDRRGTGLFHARRVRRFRAALWLGMAARAP
jgi:hypothetical protein